MLSLGETPLTDRDRGVTAALLGALTSDVPPPFAVERFLPLPSLSYDPEDLHIGGQVERGFGDHVDQTNHSVVVDEQVVVKWLTPPLPLPQPAPELMRHLVEVGFNDTAPPYAALTRVEEDQELLIALVTGYLPEARDGWDWCVDECEAGRTDFAVELGGLAGRLHRALSTLPGSQGASEDTAGRADQALAEALALTDGDDGEWLRGIEGRLRLELAPLAVPRETRNIRIHGDLHVGQILKWRDGYAVIDFDGNPTIADAAPYQPAARDVAQLTTSLEHVAQVAIKRRDTPAAQALSWARESRERMLAAYREIAGDLLDEALIRPFEVEQECRELIYAARHLPRWRYAPMGVLRTWYSEENR